MENTFTFPEKNELTSSKYQEKKPDEVYLGTKEGRFFLQNSKSGAQLSDGSFYVTTGNQKRFVLKIKDKIVYEEGKISEDFKIEGNKIIYGNGEKFVQAVLNNQNGKNEKNIQEYKKLIENLIIQIKEERKKFEDYKIQNGSSGGFTLFSKHNDKVNSYIEKVSKILLENRSTKEYLKIINIEDKKIQKKMLEYLSKNTPLTLDDFYDIITITKNKNIGDLIQKEILTNEFDIINTLDFLKKYNINVLFNETEFENINDNYDKKLLTESKYIIKHW